jgi:hypothetical protein
LFVPAQRALACALALAWSAAAVSIADARPLGVTRIAPPPDIATVLHTPATVRPGEAFDVTVHHPTVAPYSALEVFFEHDATFELLSTQLAARIAWPFMTAEGLTASSPDLMAFWLDEIAPGAGPLVVARFRVVDDAAPGEYALAARIAFDDGDATDTNLLRVVPEPATGAWLVGGLLALGAALRSTRRTS